jgi:hypothetical protein
MTVVGDRGNYYDTQDISLENVTDTKTYQQLISVNPISFEYDVTKKYLTNNTIEKLCSLLDAKIKVSMMATQPEFLDLTNLVNTTDGKPIEKQWRVKMLSQKISSSNVRDTSTITGYAILTDFYVIDNSIDEVKLEFTIDFVTKDSSVVVTVT